LQIFLHFFLKKFVINHFFSQTASDKNFYRQKISQKDSLLSQLLSERAKILYRWDKSVDSTKKLPTFAKKIMQTQRVFRP
jgi:hypothetical protein